MHSSKIEHNILLEGSCDLIFPFPLSSHFLFSASCLFAETFVGVTFLLPTCTFMVRMV